VADLASLSKTQRAGIVTALEAYDFPTAKGDKWRDSMVKAVSSADSVAARTGAIAISSGSITLKACP
jgi:hypothetical protein